MSRIGTTALSAAIASALLVTLLVVPGQSDTAAVAQTLAESVDPAPALPASAKPLLSEDPADEGESAAEKQVPAELAPGDPAPDDPTPAPTDPEPPAAQAESDEPRGPNGGIASNSPGPSTARPAEEAPEVPPGGLDPKGQSGALAAARGTIIGDNYPAQYRNLPWPYPWGAYIWDQWNFAYRQCTSWVSWRLNSANGVPFSNQYLGLTRWGDAGQWADSARSVGVRVDNTPEVGAVAWSGPWYKGASEFGHVAWVAQVLDNGYIVIEEYNNSWGGSYGTRTIAPSDFQGYIHVKDIVEPFTKTTNPTVAGAAIVGGTLTANLSGWAPTPTGLRYQWKRDGVAISGATSRTYQATLADFNTALSVDVTANRAGYRAETKTSAGTAAVLLTDSDGNGLDDTLELLPWNSDVNGDGLPDAVGFSGSGVQVALNTKTGLGASKQWVAGFGVTGGWSHLSTPRTLVDVNGDGKSDVVGFANDGVYVSTSTGSSFTTMKRWSAGFGTNMGWQVTQHPRTLADVNGDGLPDVVGFGEAGILVALNKGGSFGPEGSWSADFGLKTGWRVDLYPRLVADMNGDGKMDVIGFGVSGILVALSTGSDFSAPKRWSASLSHERGWRVEHHIRTLADVNGDGLADVIGFKDEGIYVLVGTGSGLKAAVRWTDNFGPNNGWQTGKHPRTLADVNGDGRADIVGFSETGTLVALSSGTAFGAAAQWSGEFGATVNGAGNWSTDRHPRSVSDVNGDGRADIVGFANGGMRIAYSTGRAFAAPIDVLTSMGYSAGGWRVGLHPRSMSMQTLAKRPVPTVRGAARVGQKVSGATGTWQPKPVKLSQQWYRNGVAIAGATSNEYAITPGDLGAKLSFRVVGSKHGYATAQRGSAETLVAPGVLSAPVPTVDGKLRSGSILQAKTGTWGPAPVQLKYQWNRNGSPIKGANSASYKLSNADAGRRLTVTVIGSKTGYTTTALTSRPVTMRGAPTPPRVSPFVDVPTRHTFYRQIAWMQQTGLSTGTSTPQGAVYGPKTAVTREAMAAFLYRLDALKTVKPPVRSPFVDVPVNDRFYAQIAWMADSGISTGTKTSTGLRYDPNMSVSREAMAAFLFRLEAPKGYSAPRTSPFTDVATSHRFYREIAWMHDSGLSTGTKQPRGKPKYDPKAPVSREAMAAFLFRMETS